MVLKINDVITLKNVLDKLKNGRPSIKVAYKMSKLTRDIDDSYKFYVEHLQDIVDRYGIRDENGELVPTKDGQGVTIAPDNISVATKEINELVDLDVTIGDTKFTLDELDGIDLTIEEMTFLFPFIEE